MTKQLTADELDRLRAVELFEADRKKDDFEPQSPLPEVAPMKSGNARKILVVVTISMAPTPWR